MVLVHISNLANGAYCCRSVLTGRPYELSKVGVEVKHTKILLIQSERKIIEGERNVSRTE